MSEDIRDPYSRCEDPGRCTHDLAEGVLIADLLGPRDGERTPRIYHGWAGLPEMEEAE